jgi:ribonuclease Z
VWFRHADEKFPLSVIATDVIEFDRDGVVDEKDGVRVVAFEVDHGDVIKPCYGYLRIRRPRRQTPPG